MAKEDRYHNTKMELDFVSGLGTYSEHNCGVVELLKGYLAGCAKRTDWEVIDKKAVIAAANKQLAHLQSIAA